MRRLPLALLLFAFAPASAGAQTVLPVTLKESVKDFPRSILKLKSTGPVSIDASQSAKAAYETVARTAGLNIIFDPDFRDALVGVRIQSADILDAFDVLSRSTGSFVEVLDENTIIVAPDNQTKRRDYELLVQKTFYLTNATGPQGLTQIVTALRRTLNVRYITISTVRNAIIIRTSPNQIALAEKIISEADKPQLGSPIASTELLNGPLFTLEAGRVQKLVPSRSGLQLQARAGGALSIDLNETSRGMFDNLARMAGLDIIFDQDFRGDTASSLKLENVGILDAFDLAARQTRTFWVAVDGKTILVSPDNQSKRRDYEPLIIKTFYLPTTATQPFITEIVTAIRTLLNARYLALVGNIITIRDNANRMALAERIIADLQVSNATISSAEIASGAESDLILTRRATRTSLPPQLLFQPKVKGPFSFRFDQTVQASYEAVGGAAGLRVVFDSRFKDGPAGPFKVENVEILDALDFLALQTGTIWLPTDNNTIVIAPDNQTARRDLEPTTVKTIRLTNVAQRGTEVVTALRTLLNLRQVEMLGDGIVIQDTADTIALAEKVIALLDKR